MRSETYQTAAPKTASTNTANQLPTFLEHIYELRRRLFWVVATVLVASSIAYAFVNPILEVLTKPLGNQQLYYLTPVGGLSFMIKVCTYFGLLVAVPAIMYHLYRYIEPLIGAKTRRSAIFYVGLSTILAAGGVLFAYFLSLPAALHFLTGFNIGDIKAMLTVDSYLSFVMTYLLGAALLFQIPLLLMIINTMTPLKPSRLMKAQKFVIVGAFIIGAIISPTPDIMNQAFLAVPIILMYQLGIGMVWLQNRSKRRKQTRSKAIAQSSSSQPAPKHAAGYFDIPADVLQDLTRARAQSAAQAKHTAPVQGIQIVRPVRPTAKPALTQITVPKKPVARPVVAPSRVIARPAPRLKVPSRSIDGFAPYRA